MKQSNAKLAWSALFLMLVVCPALAMLNYDSLGYVAFLLGIVIIIYAIATGKLKLLG